ncbi:MAG TPA: hypothetical protein VFF68_14205 [Anaerolineaceae bacterium]|nr:hypothetical protein [Anaerolineaceae bacterium]
MRQPIFAGLVFDEAGNATDVAYVGDEPCYVIDDAGFRRHIPSEQVDRQVLDFMKEQIKGHEDVIGEQAANMLGQDDLFTRAIIVSQIKQIDKQFDQLLETGLPEDARAYMGMMGLRIVINYHGDVIQVDQPGLIADEGDE